METSSTTCLGLESYIEYLKQTDQTVQKALEVLEEGKSFPVAPEQPVTAKKEKHDQGKEKTTAQIDQPKEKAVSGPATYEVVLPACLASWRITRLSGRHIPFCSITPCPMKCRRMNS